MSKNIFLTGLTVLFFGLGLLTSALKGTRNQKQSDENLPDSARTLELRHTADPVIPQESEFPAHSVTGRKQITNEEDDLVYQDFVMHPFEISSSSINHSWTNVQIMSPAEIDQVVHNDIERMHVMEETAFVTGRQLVYQKVSFQDLAEKNLATGKELETIIVPGFDGKEYEVVVTKWEASGKDDEVREGHLSGHLKDDPKSEVVWAYYEGMESGVISSEALNIELNIVPREERQIIVNQIDLEAQAAYNEHVVGPLSCGQKFDSLSVGDPEAAFDLK